VVEEETCLGRRTLASWVKLWQVLGVWLFRFVMRRGYYWGYLDSEMKCQYRTFNQARGLRFLSKDGHSRPVSECKVFISLAVSQSLTSPCGIFSLKR
jgi:hypothetical protein